MNEEEVLKRGYAKTMEEWWFLVDHHWNNLITIIARFSPEHHAQAVGGKHKKNAYDVYSAMNHAWYKAPNSKTLHRIPGWSALCDLCSDFPAHEDGEENDKQESN